MSFPSVHRQISGFLSPSYAVDPEPRPVTPPNAMSYSAVEGPTPDRKICLKTVPSTIDRQARRDAAMLRCASDDDKDVTLQRIEKLKANNLLQQALHGEVLQKSVEKLSSRQRKKCFTYCEIASFEKKGADLILIGSQKVDRLFWSSFKHQHKTYVPLIGVDRRRLRSSLGKEKPLAMFDHHAERSCLLWLSENIAETARKIFASNKAHMDADKIVHVNMITRFSSCRNCSMVFGKPENYFRIPDELQSILRKALSLPKEQTPDVTLIHQGLKHHHSASKSQIDELPVPELFCSSSLFDNK